jgi:hypothetical protein
MTIERVAKGRAEAGNQGSGVVGTDPDAARNLETRTGRRRPEPVPPVPGRLERSRSLPTPFDLKD